MTMRVFWMAVVLVAGVFPPGALANDKDLDAKFTPTVGKAFKALEGGAPAEALAIVEPVLAQYQAAYAGEKRRIYCSYTPEEVLLYMSMAATAKTDAVAIAPGWCVAQYVRAFALVDLGRLDEAQAGFERLLEFAPQHPRYMSELGFLFGKQRKWQQSFEAYQRAFGAAELMADKTDPEHCIALRGMGYSLIELGRFEDAEVAYNKCLKIAPGDPKSLSELEYIRQQRRKTT